VFVASAIGEQTRTALDVAGSNAHFLLSIVVDPRAERDGLVKPTSMLQKPFENSRAAALS
jgi:hypothetical protein